MVYYVPCLDNAEGIGKLNSTENGENYERHCPEANKGLDCVIPRPEGYKIPIPWPQSQDEVWLGNVCHKGLLENKSDENSIRIEGGKVIFPAGGPKSIPEMAKYLDTISQMVPDISFGQNTKVVLDIGGGIGSFGASLLERNASTLTIAPKDAHENQIQLALERGVPAMYVPIKACITPIPESGSEYRANVTWSVRLHNPPIRLQSIRIDSYIARKELFKAESKYWYEITLRIASKLGSNT
ncbi:putative S-adenosyl-L-methionine-dependent methyltransferase [Dillenia turbinata]|uniref:Methyltransferase n=1 Tax=Dillenia turbinata TaxID=194707 RepID=A0AAN8W3E9_9MAGN